MLSIVTTTINIPKLLEGYCQNARNFGHSNSEVNFIVIGDKRTPREAGVFCVNLTKKYGYQVDYYNIPKQINFLRKFPALKDHLPFNSVERRNIGILKAYLDGANTIVMLDDDNFILENQDFVVHYNKAGKEDDFLCVSSSSGWYNVCEILEEERSLPVYHRGFPLSKRQQATATFKKKKGKIIVSAGLWLDAPDIDAFDWLYQPVKTTSIVKRFQKGLSVDIATYSPFNSQNTALAREAIPAYFLSPYLNRHCDVWASYIINKIADHLGHYIHFGLPLVRQNRNPHNYYIDLDRERFGMEANDYFIEALNSIELSIKDYKTCFAEIVNYLDKNRKDIFPFYNRKDIFPFNEKRNKIIIDGWIKGMKIWRDIFCKINF